LLKEEGGGVGGARRGRGGGRMEDEAASSDGSKGESRMWGGGVKPQEKEKGTAQFVS